MIKIKSIWEHHKPTETNFIVRTRIEEIVNFSCFVATNFITGQYLYIMAISGNSTIPELKKYRFKGVEIFVIDTPKGKELNIYLLDNDLKEVFSLFIENILNEIQASVIENEVITKTFNVISKWKKLFEKISNVGLTIQEQKGLLGELLFLDFLLDNPKTSFKAVDYWASSEPDFQAKDFVLEEIGFEIKFTSAQQPKIKISNEKQLDAENLKHLFLILYSAEAVKSNGFSLPTLIEQIREKIQNQENLSVFNMKLGLKGYFEKDKEHYLQLYSLEETFVFRITPEFPKIIKNQLPLGIYDTSYSIEISAVEKFQITPKQLLDFI